MSKPDCHELQFGICMVNYQIIQNEIVCKGIIMELPLNPEFQYQKSLGVHQDILRWRDYIQFKFMNY